MVSEREEDVGHPPTHFTMFYDLFLLRCKGGCKLETGAWTAVLTGRHRDRELCMSRSWALPRQRDRAKVAAWKRDVRAHSAVCSPSLADSSWRVSSSLVLRSTCAGGTCAPAHVNQGRGETKEQMENLVSRPQLPFDLWSLNITSAKVRECQEVKTIAGKLEIHPSAFTPSSADAFGKVN